MVEPSTVQSPPARYRLTEHMLDGQHGPIRYWESTPAQGVPVLLIHGYAALIEHWRRVMFPLVRAHTLYALDLYGFGFSARPPVDPSKELWAAQAAQLLQQRGVGPAVVVGHSLGGMVAAQLAAQYPQLVRGLVLVNSAGLPMTAQPSAFDRLFSAMLQTEGVGAMLTSMFANSWTIRQGLLAAYHRKEQVTPELVNLFSAPLREPDGTRYYLATSRSFRDLVLDLQPGQVQVPTLIMWGEEDRSIPVSVATILKQQMFPQAEIRRIPGSGHCPFDETPDAFCEVLLPWLEQFRATSAE